MALNSVFGRRQVREKFILIILSLACCGNLLAQANSEPIAIVELGGAADWSVKDGASSFGPDIAAEVTPIDNWLELEAGVTPLFRGHSIEWGTDLLFKKPWTLSRKAELMVGMGPEWIHGNESGITTNSVAAEAVLDFMFWPSTKRKLGWFVEPAYERVFGQGHEQSIGISFGLLIALFPKARP